MKPHRATLRARAFSAASAACVASLAAALAACGASPGAAPTPAGKAGSASPPGAPTSSALADADDATPKVRLPSDTRPTAQSIELTIDPKADRVSGKSEISITLDRARRVVWLHGKNLTVSRASAALESGREIVGTYAQRDESGFASITFPEPLPAGKARLRIEYDAPWGPKLEGLHKIVHAGEPYAYTQFENIAARSAFPCFDEPGFKIAWDTTLIVPKGQQAIANTKEIARADEGDKTRVHFAPTLPLPSYLLAFAVGPLDVVNAPDVPPNGIRKRPLPLRGVTPKGRGKEITYALAHTGEILALLERYFGIEYPYDKLDMIAVPDKGGAMENAGAVTFADSLLLFDEKTAPIGQKRGYAEVVAHELAHQWTGDLVTSAWWDDIWLNEAFATWVQAKITDQWDPKIEAPMSLLRGMQGAIGNDALATARKIRQPIESTNDIENAFDSLTYQKGGSVLAMFERWVGPETFQRGVHDYLAKHAFGNAVADDFLNAESSAAGKDVKTPFATFLDQPGVPFVEAELRCDGAPRIHLKQSRYFPIGSDGDVNKTWQIPICARYGVGKATREACTVLTEREGDLAVGDACPDWVFPNADSTGYFRFALAPKDLAALRSKGLGSLTLRERVAFGNSLRAAFNRAALPMKDIFEAAAPLASDSHHAIAGEPMGFVGAARDWLANDPLLPSLETYARSLFASTGHKLGWDRAKSDDGDRIELRARVLAFLAFTARDPAVRAEAKKRGLAYLGYARGGAIAIHPEAVDANLVGIALGVVGEEADRALWNAVKEKLAKTDDAEMRGRFLALLTSARSPELVDAVRELTFDPMLRATEVSWPLWTQVGEPKLRDATWEWVKAHYDRVLAALPEHHGRTQIISMGSSFCDDAHVADVQSFFGLDKIAQIDGGPRVLANTLEEIRLCSAKRKLQEPSAREFFKKR